MPDFKKIIPYALWSLMAMVLFSACKKEIITTTNTNTQINEKYGFTVYQLDTVNLYPTNAEKTKQKTSSQYVSILYSDLFQKTIPTNELFDLAEITLACGDKQLINDVVILSYLNRVDVIMPTDAYMNDNLETFIEETYIRFFSRKPNALEAKVLKNMIENDTEITVEMVYNSFMLSNEYLFY